MDDLELELSQKDSDALNRWVEINNLYNSKLPPVYEIGQGQRLGPPFVMDEEYLVEMAALDAEREKAWREHCQASDKLIAYKQRR
jgi:hypothetical protein